MQVKKSLVRRRALFKSTISGGRCRAVSDRLRQIEQKAREPGAYLQVVGMVQAFALGYLVIQQGATTRDDDVSLLQWFATPTDPELHLFALQFVLTFLLIVLTWYANTQHVIGYGLRHGVLDAFIPFTFALPQFYLIQFCEPDHFRAWCLAFVGYTTVGSLAYTHMFLGIYQRAAENKEFSDARETRESVGELYPLCSTIGIILAGLVAWLGVRTTVFEELTIAYVLLLVVIGFASNIANLYWRRATREPAMPRSQSYLRKATWIIGAVGIATTLQLASIIAFEFWSRVATG